MGPINEVVVYMIYILLKVVYRIECVLGMYVNQLLITTNILALFSIYATITQYIAKPMTSLIIHNICMYVRRIMYVLSSYIICST